MLRAPGIRSYTHVCNGAVVVDIDAREICTHGREGGGERERERENAHSGVPVRIGSRTRHSPGERILCLPVHMALRCK